jgi:hypothetical protein
VIPVKLHGFKSQSMLNSLHLLKLKSQGSVVKDNNICFHDSIPDKVRKLLNI